MFFHGDIHPVPVTLVHAVGDGANPVLRNVKQRPKGYEIRSTSPEPRIQRRTDILTVGRFTGIAVVLSRISGIVSCNLTVARTIRRPIFLFNVADGLIPETFTPIRCRTITD
jgi:hypothetical protein